MISKEDFIRQVTEAGHASKLRRMTLDALDHFCRNTNYDLCVYMPDKTELRDAVTRIVDREMLMDIVTMAVRKRSQGSGFYTHHGSVQNLDATNSWRGYDYYVVPVNEEFSLGLEELI